MKADIDMPKSRSSLLTRRGLIAAGGALGLVAALTACGGNDSAKDGSGSKDKGSAASGPWSFKDDLGKEVSAKSTPKNVVAFTGTAAALYDYGVNVKGVFGPTKTADGKPDVQAGSMDISKVEILGNVYDEFNVEKYAALQPDLLVTNTWDGTYWYVPEASKDKILKLAPAAAIGVGGDVTMDKALARTADLAGSLGADLNAKKTVDAKARFEAASAKLREATKANPGIKVLVGSGSADLFYVSTPATSADLKYFQSLGVEFVVPEKTQEGGFFESLSWENSRQVQGRRRPPRQPHRHPPARAAEGQADLGRDARRQGLPDHPPRDRADLLVREVRADPGRAHEVHPERQEGQLTSGRPAPAPHAGVGAFASPGRLPRRTTPPPHPAPTRLPGGPA